MLESFLRDLRFAARGLRRHPGFSAVAVLTLALGTGATTAVFSVVYGVVLRPLPFPNAERLVRIVQILEPTTAAEEPVRAGLTSNQFADLQEHSKTLAAVGAFLPAPRTLTGAGVPVRLSGAGVTPALFASLGVPAALGRTFVPEDARRAPLSDPVVILSHQTWARYFGSSPDILERRIALGDTTPRVIGVMPEGFGFPSLASASMSTNSAGALDDAPEFWLAMSPFQRSDEPGFALIIALAILRESVTPEQALADIRSILGPLPQGLRATLEVVPARRESARTVSDVLAIFQLGVTLILLVACVNVVNLLLARAAHRRRETAIRLALGASGARVAREHVAESVLLAVAGGGLGCLFAYAIVAGLRSLPPHLLPRLRDLQIDGTVLSFALALSVGTGLAVGLFSSLRVARSRDSHTSLALGGTRTAPHRRLRPSGALVVLEIAATMVLVTGAGLLINSYAHLMRVSPGLDPQNALTFQLALTGQRYISPASQQQTVRDILERVRTVPAVASAAATGLTLDGAPVGPSQVVVNGRAVRGAIRQRFVTSQYFRALGTPMRQGREFVDADSGPASAGVIVNEAFVRRHLDGENPIGASIGYGDGPARPIVGVAADSKLRLDEEAPPTVFLPANGPAFFGLSTFIVRSTSDPRALLSRMRQIVANKDSRLAVHNAMTVDEMITHTAASPRLYGLVAFWCAVVALLLAGTGLYGVLAYSVGTQTQELGIRMALGATAGGLTVAVIRQGLVLTAAGVAAGLAGSFFATRFLDSLLFGLTPHDPSTFAATVAMFVVVALAASYVPCRRATRVDPVVALRAE